MRFCTDDGRFGVVIRPWSASYDRRFFQFQLVIDGQVIGKVEPDIVYTAVERRLRQIHELSDPRLSPAVNASDVLQLALTDEDLHDDLIMSWSESLDEWLVIAYVFGDTAVFLAQQYESGSQKSSGAVLATYVPIEGYTEVVDQVVRYWLEHETV